MNVKISNIVFSFGKHTMKPRTTRGKRRFTTGPRRQPIAVPNGLSEVSRRKTIRAEEGPTTRWNVRGGKPGRIEIGIGLFHTRRFEGNPRPGVFAPWPLTACRLLCLVLLSSFLSFSRFNSFPISKGLYFASIIE